MRGTKKKKKKKLGPLSKRLKLKAPAVTVCQNMVRRFRKKKTKALQVCTPVPVTSYNAHKNAVVNSITFITSSILHT